MSTFTTTCYNKTKTYKESSRKAQIKKYLMGMNCSDGSEQERYTNI